MIRLSHALRVSSAAALSVLSGLLAGCGIGTSSTTAPPPAAPSTFVYVTNAGANSVSAYKTDSTSGALTAVSGSPFPAGSQPMSAALDPAGKFLFVANAGNATGVGTVSAYTIDASSGALTAVADSPFASGDPATALAVDPTGKFLYVSTRNANPCCSSGIAAYTINPSTGALTPMPHSPFAAGAFLQQLVVEPTGRFLYVADNGFLKVSALAIYPTGALGLVAGSPFDAGIDPLGVAVDPSGKFLYVTNAISASAGDVLAYTIDSTSGALTPVMGWSPGVGPNPLQAAVDPTGKFLYVTVNGGLGGGPQVASLAINPTTGALTPAGAPAPAQNPTGIAVDPSGRFVYVTNPNLGTVAVFAINATTGALSEVPGSPFAAGGGPFGIAVRRPR